MNSVSLKRLWAELGFQSRLTIGLSGVFAVILALGYWALFLEFQGELQHDFDHALYNYTTDLLQNVDLNGAGKADWPYEVFFSPDKIFPFPHGDALVKLFQPPFKETFSFTTDRDAPVDLAAVQSLMQARTNQVFFDLTSAKGLPWRGLLMRVTKSSEQEAYFFVAVPRGILTAQENKFRSIFIAGQLIILALAIFMISVLARSLLQSLQSLTSSIRTMPLNQTDYSFDVPSGPPEINLLAELLNRLLAQVQQSLVAHQEFVSKAAHQLKTPLTIAKGHLEQFQKSLPPDSAKQLAVAIDEIDIMSGTINNLLMLVQIESGFQSINTTDVNLLDQLLAEIDHIDYLAHKKALKFQVICNDTESSAGPWTINTDPQLLSIVLNNLLENSVKYASESPIEVQMNLLGDQVSINISNKIINSGKSLSAEELKAKYVRGQHPETGQGLGLYIAYKVASILNIQLGFQNYDGTFAVQLRFPKKTD